MQWFSGGKPQHSKLNRAEQTESDWSVDAKSFKNSTATTRQTVCDSARVTENLCRKTNSCHRGNCPIRAVFALPTTRNHNTIEIVLIIMIIKWEARQGTDTFLNKISISFNRAEQSLFVDFFLSHRTESKLGTVLESTSVHVQNSI